MSWWSVLIGGVGGLTGLAMCRHRRRKGDRPAGTPPYELTEAQKRWHDVTRAEKQGDMTTEFPRVDRDDDEQG
jgi:hypothetical protein